MQLLNIAIKDTLELYILIKLHVYPKLMDINVVLEGCRIQMDS